MPGLTPLRTIVWATDGSEHADHALQLARELASGPGRRLVVLHSREVVTGRAAGYPILADDLDLIEKVRDQVAGLRRLGLLVDFHILRDDRIGVARQLADGALEAEADCIVVGARGRSPIASLLVGSVTQRLIHLAACPVIAVPARWAGGSATEPLGCANVSMTL